MPAFFAFICKNFTRQTNRTNQNIIDIVYNLHSIGNLWLAERDGKRFTAPSLEELDSLISEHVRQEFISHKGQELDIRMYFDQSEIPEWMRQYSNHYFNRQIRVKI